MCVRGPGDLPMRQDVKAWAMYMLLSWFVIKKIFKLKKEKKLTV